MKNYGFTLKQIRKSLNISQKNISNGIMSQSNYSKVEHGEIDIPFTKMVELLNQIGMSVDEFLYIHQDYQKNPGIHLNRITRLKAGDAKAIQKNLVELKAIKNPTPREKELLMIFEALALVLENKYQVASKKVTIIWDRLKKHDVWYLYDIHLINSILYLFPIETAGAIVDLALERLKDYQKLRNISKISANLQINYLLLLMNEGEYYHALDLAERLVRFSLDHHLDKHLATAYVRKGILLEILDHPDYVEFYNQGFKLLETMNYLHLIEELKSEQSHYT